MPKTTPKRNRGGKAKSKGDASSKSPVGNSKTSGKKQSPRGKGTISEEETRSLIPQKSLKSATPRDMMEIIAAAPKITGAFQEPYPRKRENDWAFTIEIEKSKKFDAINLSKYYNGGQHVVAIIVPINNVREWPMWKAFDTGEILQAYHGSDFERTFEVQTRFLADLLEMSPRNLQLLEKKKHAVKFGRDRWDLVGTVKAYLKAIKDEFQGRGGKEYSEERTKDKREQRLMRELDRRQKAEQLVDAEEMKAASFEMGVKYRKALENLIARVAAELVAAKTQTKVRAILKPEIDQILINLSLDKNPEPKRKKSAGSSRKRK